MKKITFLILVCIIISPHLLAQNSISGKVTDAEKDKPLVGVTVSVKNTTIGTSTGSDGTYELTVPEMGEILVFSFIGMISEKLKSGNKKKFIVALQSRIHFQLMES